MGKKYREYINHRDLRKEAEGKIKDFDAIIGRAKVDYEKLRETGISTTAFSEQNITEITVSRKCWNHVFKHPNKRRTKAEKIERALCLPMAIKLLVKTTTYQEVSKEKDKGNNMYLSFAIIGYVRGNRIKVIIRKQLKNTNAKYVLFSFWQMSSAPQKKETEDKKS